MIEIIDKHTAKLIVNIGSGKTRKRKTKKVTYSGKRELDRLYREFETECKRAPVVKLSVKELVDSYIKNRELLGAKATTIKGYQSAAKRVNLRFGSISASSLTTYQIDDFVAEMANSGLSAKTIINTISILNSAYDRAVRTGQLQANPCKYVTLPKKKKPEIITFSNDELVTFIDMLSRERLDYKVGYELCLFCGMRRSEVLGLREQDVNVLFSSVTIRNTRHRIEGDEDIVQDTKTAQSHRTLAVPEFVVRDIDVLINEHHANPYNDTDYLIQNGFGQPMSPSTFTKYIRIIEDKAGLPPVSVHGLRHTFASMLNSEGVDIARISAELGHSTIGTTLNIYTHVFGDVSASSRGIADSINAKFENSATFLPPEAKEKA